ncbi:hypothetical protein LG299_00380 [Microbacterium lacus]|uniref:hypothetical protein n=1 Tax=Microbacterium lacus TaxID=415217 RepID=UPI00384CF0F2
MARSVIGLPLSGVPRVNLIPRSEIERRDRAATLRGWGWGIVATLLALMLIIAGAIALNWLAQQRLVGEQARTNTLLTELASLSEVSVALSTQTDLKSFRAAAMASDLEWTGVYSTLTGALPAGVTLTGFNLITGPVPVEGVEVTEQVGLDGGLTFSSPGPIEMATLIRAYRALPGVIDADGWQVASSTDTGDTAAAYTYELTITFDQSLYTGAYAGEED